MKHVFIRISKAILASCLAWSLACTSVGAADISQSGQAAVDSPGDCEERSSCPTGGFEFKELHFTEEEVAGMPVFTGEPKMRFFSAAAYADNDWNQDGKATYGCSIYGYTKMSSNEKRAYESILYATAGSDLKGEDSSASCFMNSAKVNGGYRVPFPNGVSKKEMVTAYCAVYEDHPQFYWLESNYATEKKELIIAVDELYDEKAERERLRACLGGSTGIGRELLEAYKGDESKDDYDKMIALHNKILEKATYAYNAQNKPVNAAWAHNITGLLSGNYQDAMGRNRVVCEGYAKTFQYILNLCGVNNIYVVGNADGGHTWNMVYIEGRWYYVDLTWDDQDTSSESAYNYIYTCMTKRAFESRHKPFTTLTKWWLYDLPMVRDTDDFVDTYFERHYALATEENCRDINSFIQKAGASSPNDDLFILSTSKTLINEIAEKLDLTTYSSALEYGAYCLYKKDGAKIYKVKAKADDLTVVPEEYILDLTKEKQFTLKFSTDTDGCDDYINMEVSDKAKAGTNVSSVQVTADQNGGRSATVNVIGKKNGVVFVTGSALAGKVKAVCKVIVSGSSLTQNIFKDSACTQSVTEEETIAYLNGGKVKRESETVNTKMLSLYTNMETPMYLDSNNKNKKGKVVVGITSSDTVPSLSNGKIVDKAAANIAKASIKSGTGNRAITVKAQRAIGTVYLWVLGLGRGNQVVAMDYCPITIKAAPLKVTLQNKAAGEEDAVKLTAGMAAVNQEVYVYLNPVYKDAGKKKQIAQGATFTPNIGNNSSYVNVEKVSQFVFKITGIALKDQKATSVKVVFVCDQNGKKAALKFKFANPVESVTLDSMDKTILQKKNDKVVFHLKTITAGGEDMATTDRARVFISNGIAEEGRYIISKSCGYKGSVSDNTVTITKSKGLTEECTIYIIYTDNTTKTQAAYELATISADGIVTAIW